MRKIFLAALLGGTIATPAFAQSGEASPFTGFRLEGLAGYDTLSSGDNDDDGVDTGDDEGDESIDGAAFGIGAGFDWDLGGVVAGIEGEFSESTGEQGVSETIDGVNFSSSVEIGRDPDIGGRIGFRAAPSTLVYAKGGYTNTSIEASFDDDTDSFEFDTNVDGFRLGAGIEQLIGTNMYGKLEYRYSNYSTLDFSDDEDEDFDTDIDLDRHQVMLGVGFRF